jgi:hypothetical protein
VQRVGVCNAAVEHVEREGLFVVDDVAGIELIKKYAMGADGT